MSEASIEKGTDTPFMDDSDDFIQSHIDSFFPPSDQQADDNQEEIDVESEQSRADHIDSDTDNIPDVIEQDPKNYSDLDARAEHFWDEYKDKGNKTQQQFNPRTVEPFKPGLDKLDVETKSGWTGEPVISTREAWAEITLHVNDTAGIDRIILENKDKNTETTLYSPDGEELDDEPGVYKFEADLDINYWRDYKADGWDLNITLIDENGNEFVKEKHVQSQFGDFIDVLGLGWVADALAEAASAAMDLASAMWSLVKNIIKSTLMPLIQPILNYIEDWRENVADVLMDAYTEFNNTGSISEATIESLNQAIMGPLFIALSALSAGVIGALTAVMGVTLGAGSILMMVISFAVPMIISQLVGEDSEVGKLLSLEFAMDPILSFVDFVLSGFMSGSSDESSEGGSLMASSSLTQSSSFNLKGVLIGLIETLLSGLGWVFSLPTLTHIRKDKTGFVPAGYAINIGLLSLLFSPIMLTLAAAGETLHATVAGALAALWSGVGTAIGGYASWVSVTPVGRTAGKIGFGLNIASILLYMGVTYQNYGGE